MGQPFLNQSQEVWICASVHHLVVPYLNKMRIIHLKDILLKTIFGILIFRKLLKSKVKVFELFGALFCTQLCFYIFGRELNFQVLTMVERRFLRSWPVSSARNNSVHKNTKVEWKYTCNSRKC